MSDRSGKSKRLAKRDYEALANFRYALRQFLAFSEKAARSVDLSPQQHQGLYRQSKERPTEII